MKNERDASCSDAKISRGDIAGASIRLVATAMSYNACIVIVAKYAPIARSIDANSASLAVFCDHVPQS